MNRWLQSRLILTTYHAKLEFLDLEFRQELGLSILKMKAPASGSMIPVAAL
jgi:hypothetical protein